MDRRKVESPNQQLLQPSSALEGASAVGCRPRHSCSRSCPPAGVDRLHVGLHGETQWIHPQRHALHVGSDQFGQQVLVVQVRLRSSPPGMITRRRWAVVVASCCFLENPFSPLDR